MKSPFTGGEVVLLQEKAELVFRKEKFHYVSLYYQCVDTKERFTTTEIDEINLSQVYNQYRVKYGIPFVDEIRHIRQAYDLSASKMSQILGFGDNQYRLYENGDMPSETNGKILNSIRKPELFKVFVENAKNQFDDKEYEKICVKLKKAVESRPTDVQEQLIFGTYSRGIYNGYATQSYDKLKNIILYFIEKCGSVFYTKMNKLLFYTDFLSYKKRGCGMSGLAYQAIQYGPVPVRWDRVYSLIDDVYPEMVEFSSGLCGTQLCSALSPDMNAFTEEERLLLDAVVDKFKDISSSGISEMSHHEEAWKNCHHTGDMISYNEAFTLRGIDL